MRRVPAAPTVKPWKWLGPGVLEVVESHDGNAYRAVNTVRFEKAVYVLHAFQKKSPSGMRYMARFGWLEIESFRPFTLVIDRNGVLRDYFFGSQELDTFEVKIREYL